MMATPLSASPLVVAQEDDALPIARDIRHLMSNPNTKPGLAHAVGAIVEDEGTTDPEEEEESSDDSRRSSMDGTMTGHLGLDIAKYRDGTLTRVLSPPPKAPRARMLSLPSLNEEEDMTYASFVATPVTEGFSLNSDSLAAKLANLQDTGIDVYRRLAFLTDLEDDEVEFSLEPEEISVWEQDESEDTAGSALLGLQT